MLLELATLTVLTHTQYRGACRRYHLFLSHSWLDGQDSMRHLKACLGLLMLPDLEIFLDVDNLEFMDELTQAIDESQTVLLYLTQGYIESHSCRTELLRALLAGKTLCVMIDEGGPKSESMTLERACARLAEAWTDEDAPMWGLGQHARDWAVSLQKPLPTATSIVSAVRELAWRIHLTAAAPPRCRTAASAQRPRLPTTSSPPCLPLV